MKPSAVDLHVPASTDEAVAVLSELRDHPDASEPEIREALSGNLRRCTGYQGVIEAVRLAAAAGAETQEPGA